VSSYEASPTDNDLLDYDEALLIFNNVANVVGHLRAVETRVSQPKLAEAQPSLEDEIPF
jgi:hypothetical protein